MISLREFVPHVAPLAAGLFSVIAYLLLPAHFVALLPVAAAFVAVLVLHERDDYRRARWLIDSGALRQEIASGRTLDAVALELLATLRRVRRRDWWVHGPLLAIPFGHFVYTEFGWLALFVAVGLPGVILTEFGKMLEPEERRPTLGVEYAVRAKGEKGRVPLAGTAWSRFLWLLERRVMGEAKESVALLEEMEEQAGRKWLRWLTGAPPPGRGPLYRLMVEMEEGRGVRWVLLVPLVILGYVGYWLWLSSTWALLMLWPIPLGLVLLHEAESYHTTRRLIETDTLRDCYLAGMKPEAMAEDLCFGLRRARVLQWVIVGLLMVPALIHILGLMAGGAMTVLFMLMIFSDLVSDVRQKAGKRSVGVGMTLAMGNLGEARVRWLRMLAVAFGFLLAMILISAVARVVPLVGMLLIPLLIYAIYLVAQRTVFEHWDALTIRFGWEDFVRAMEERCEG